MACFHNDDIDDNDRVMKCSGVKCFSLMFISLRTNEFN